MSSATDQRREAVQKLLAQAEEWDAKAGAYTAIADLLAEAPIPVSRYAETWRIVKQRLRRDAVACEQNAINLKSRIEDLQHAEEARQNWTESDS